MAATSDRPQARKPLDPLERAQVARSLSPASYVDIAQAIGCSDDDLSDLRRGRPAPAADRLEPRSRSPSASRSAAACAGASLRAIARELARAPSTISREVARGGAGDATAP